MKTRLYYQNIRGINTKLQDVFQISTTTEYSIVTITETCLDSNVYNSKILDAHISTVLLCGRVLWTYLRLTCGGGVCLKPIYLNSKITSGFKELCSVDIFGAKISASLYTYYIILLYIPSNNSIETYHFVTEIF